MEPALVTAALAALIGLLVLSRDGRARALALICATLVLAGWALLRSDDDAALREALPGAVETGGYVTSDACRACHPAEYHAWHDSYHRTMTQVATPETVLADWDGVQLEDRGRRARLERRGEELWAEVPDPLWYEDDPDTRSAQPPQIDVRVVMTTGSHHLQNYWFRRPKSGEVYGDSPDNGALVQVPWVWLVEEDRWAPVQDSFLTPPTSEPQPPQVWNTSCHLCHSVAPEPRFSGDRFDTRTAELGIACEACHGPGEAHVRANRSPLRRYWRRISGRSDDPTIVNAARLGKERSAEVCGQCHSFSRVVDFARWQRTGVPFRPGEELAPSKAVLRFSDRPSETHLLAQLEEEPGALVGRFWGDGTIRVAGREYNGLIESACYQRGEMTCLSCHSLHDYAEPSDQLARDRAGNEACLQCHETMRGRVAAHTHHAEPSPGSDCMNCHMPHTTYGLFVAMRSHRIDSPSVAVTQRTGRPNACNLCHLDRTLAWTDRHMVDWYDATPTPLDADDRTLAAGVRWLIEGDAAQRAITAWHMGWEPALQASGRDWQAAHLAVLLADPYSTVRRVAQVSLGALPGFEDFRYDYLADWEQLAAKRQEAWGRWQRRAVMQLDRSGDALLIDADGRLDLESLQRIHARRDDTPMRIIE